ncbi:MAG: hypothetical protein ACTMIR_13325 [Cellulomonadaceae bacterium]
MTARFNPAPGWPPTPQGWTPPPGWQPDPSWPAAPAGWQFWVEDAPAVPGVPAPSAPSAEQTQFLPQQPPAPSAPSAEQTQFLPPTVAPAQYASYSGGPQGQQPYPGAPVVGGPGPQGPRKKSPLVWILPVAALLIIGIVIGILFLTGVLGGGDESDGGDASPTSSPTATATPTEEPTDEPTPTPTDEPTQTPTEEPTNGGGSDAETTAFCTAHTALAPKTLEMFTAETVGDLQPVVSSVYDEMVTMQAPDDIADAWEYNVNYIKGLADYLLGVDPATPGFEAQANYMTDSGIDVDELTEVSTQLQDFAFDNCY